MLQWRSLVSDRSHQFLQSGVELAAAFVPGTSHRFQLCEIRIATRDGQIMVPDREVVVRDAANVSDADIREGIRPKIIGRFASADEAIAFCMKELEQ